MLMRLPWSSKKAPENWTFVVEICEETQASFQNLSEHERTAKTEGLRRQMFLNTKPISHSDG